MVIRFALNTLTLLWYTGIALIIYFGWTIREHRYLVAESGIGYWLGIIGGSMMLLLLIYPSRKKHSNWVYLGSVKFWFKLHMFLGVVGPVLIIYHSGYSLGSLNSRVAFISMLIVASSGLVGRYLYRRIHHGLYGKKIQFDDLYLKNEISEKKINTLRKYIPDIVDQLKEFEEVLTVHHTGQNRSLWFYLSHRWKLRRIRQKVLAKYKSSKERKIILDRVWSLRSICNLGINEILFSYWHILHYPLFLMLVISGFIHVGVVHFY